MGGAYEGGVDQMRQRIGLVAIERGVDHNAALNIRDRAIQTLG